MLEVTLLTNSKGNKFKLLMKGHCNADEKGKDLVCASASTICYAIEKTLKADRKALKSAPKCTITEGHAEFVFKPKKEYINTILVQMDALMNGFKVLAEDYPDNIKIK